MTDDLNRDDEAPELRKILDQMHGEEPSVFDEMEEGSADPQELPVQEPPVQEPLVDFSSENQAQEPVVGETDDYLEERLHVEPAIVEEETSEVIVQEPVQPIHDPAPQVDDTSAPSVPEAAREEPLESEINYKPSVTMDLNNASMKTEASFVSPPESLKPDLDRLPVTLDCSLRSISKTLGEVSQMKAGEIITLGCGLEGPIDLKANGRVFATGRLVMVDNQLAVEVIEKLDS